MTKEESVEYVESLRAAGWYVVFKKRTDLHPVTPTTIGWGMAATHYNICPVVVHAPTKVEAIAKLKLKMELGQISPSDEE